MYAGLRSTSPARPERAEPFHDLAGTRQKVGSRLPETALLPLWRMAVDAVAGLVQPWEPRLRHRHESDPPEVHNEGAGLAEAGRRLPVEWENAERRGARQATMAGLWCVPHEGGQCAGRPGNRQRIAKVQRAGPRRVLTFGEGAPYEVAILKGEQGQPLRAKASAASSRSCLAA